jgi:hypothetical protein
MSQDTSCNSYMSYEYKDLGCTGQKLYLRVLNIFGTKLLQLLKGVNCQYSFNHRSNKFKTKHRNQVTLGNLGLKKQMEC